MSWRDQLRIVLVHSRNPLNMGAAARAMLNFGFSDLWLVEPYEPAFQEARKSAVGAAEVLEKARVTSDIAEALGDASLVVAASAMKGRSARHVQRLLPEGALFLRTHLDTRPAALLFGSEKYGLRKQDLSFCDWMLSIPTAEDCPSMNLGQAVAVCCYELSCKATAVPTLKTPASVSAAQRERIVKMLIAVLEPSGFILPASRESQTLKIRRWVNRLRLAPEDARVLKGMLRQIKWKLDHP